jgi:hypothetical protein
MKKGKFIFLFLALISFFGVTVPTSSLKAEENIPSVRGFSLGTEFTEFLGDFRPGIRGSWWHDYFGMDLSWFGVAYEVKLNGTKVADTSLGWFDLGFKGGSQFGHLKPYGRLGFGANVQSDNRNDVDYKYSFVHLTIGMDFAISDHFNFGISFLDFKGFANSEAKNSGATTDLSGSNSSLLSGAQFSYQF